MDVYISAYCYVVVEVCIWCVYIQISGDTLCSGAKQHRCAFQVMFKAYASVQDIFLEVNERFFEEVAAGLWDAQNEEALEWAVEETGQEVIELDEEEAEKWIERVQPIQEDFVVKMDELGFDGEEILETVKRLAEEHQ